MAIPPDTVTFIAAPFDDAKLIIVAPVPTNVPSEETPTAAVNPDAVPVRLEPSPTNDVAVTTPATFRPS